MPMCVRPPPAIPDTSHDATPRPLQVRPTSPWEALREPWLEDRVGIDAAIVGAAPAHAASCAGDAARCVQVEMPADRAR